MPIPEAQQTIHDAVTAWEGIEAHPHRYGGKEFRLLHRSYPLALAQRAKQQA